VVGLRREEVATLAGVSFEYYKRLELGNASGVSAAVLEALANALRLDDAERAHLFDLARADNPGAPRRQRRAGPQQVRPVMHQILDAVTAPATISNERVAKDPVAHLRSEAGRDPYDRALSGLVGELSTRSDSFRTCSSPLTVCGSPSSPPRWVAERPRRSNS
jgi:transcriptional regulator with XRE-family HTH domain